MPDQDELIGAVNLHARDLCDSIKSAQEAGVSEALILPALIAVFREAGMLPEGLDFGSLLGMFS